MRGRTTVGRLAKESEGEGVCPATAALELLGRKWTGFILWALLDGPRRYTEILHAVPGITDRVLSVRLKELERAGIVTRRQYAEIPARVEYSLTERGRDLAPIIAEMARWSERWAGRRTRSSSGRGAPGP